MEYRKISGLNDYLEFSNALEYCSNNVAEAQAATFGLQVSCRYDHGTYKKKKGIYRLNWKVISDVLINVHAENCGYPMVCGRYGICTSNGKCSCPPEKNFFRPLDVGCLQLTSIYCNSSQYHSYVELKNTTYFTFEFSDELISGILPFEGKKLEDCKGACLRNCSCKACCLQL